MKKEIESRFPQIRKVKFKDMCKRCIYNPCSCKCGQCGCVGIDKTHGIAYCKCYARAGEKETKCYYYRKDRVCKK